MDSEQEFYDKWHNYFRENNYKGRIHYPDEYDMDQFALIVIDETPTEHINKILRDNMEASDDVADLWLVDMYENLPDFDGPKFIEGTPPNVDASWLSPFAGKSLSEVAAWVRGIPKPPKAICKRYFAVVQRDMYEKYGQVLVCKIIDGQDEPQTIPIEAHRLAVWVRGYKRDEWRDDWKAQRF